MTAEGLVDKRPRRAAGCGRQALLTACSSARALQVARFLRSALGLRGRPRGREILSQGQTGQSHASAGCGTMLPRAARLILVGASCSRNTCSTTATASMQCWRSARRSRTRPHARSRPRGRGGKPGLHRRGSRAVCRRARPRRRHPAHRVNGGPLRPRAPASMPPALARVPPVLGQPVLAQDLARHLDRRCSRLLEAGRCDRSSGSARCPCRQLGQLVRDRCCPARPRAAWRAAALERDFFRPCESAPGWRRPAGSRPACPIRRSSGRS